MDPVTHTLTGLALSRAGLNRWSPYATAVVLLAANAPDIDLVTLAGGSATYLHYHRHLTHSLILLPVMALLPVLLVRLAARKPLRWKWAYGAALIAVASHLALDWTNTYGVRFLLPFSAEWIRLDITNLFDIWIWAVLIVAALGPLLAKLVSSEIGARPGSGRGVALAALAFFLCYDVGRYVAHQRALAVLDARLYQDAVPARVAAFPNAVNPFRWRGLVETPAFYSILDVDLFREFDPTTGRILYKAQPDPTEQAAWNAARRTMPFEVFLQFSQYPLRRFSPAEKEDQAIRVEDMDLRFGAPPTPGFVAEAVVSPGGRVIESRFLYRARTPGQKQ